MKWLVPLSLVLVFTATVAREGAAQSVPGSSGAVRQYESRAELDSLARAAERAGRSSEAWLLRSRLERGDFQEGDRIVLMLDNTPPRTDTLQVRAGKAIRIAGMADLSLEGVLRSELEDTLRSHMGRYLRNPALRATPLIPISVTGSVGQPGYYYVAADLVLRDLIMRAGGPATADLDRIVIKRGGDVIWKAQDVRVALADGISIERLHLRAGDEISVPERRERMNLQTVFSIVSASAALVLLVMQVGR